MVCLMVIFVFGLLKCLEKIINCCVVGVNCFFGIYERGRFY